MMAADFDWVVPLENVAFTDVDVDVAENSVAVGNLMGTADFDPTGEELILTGVEYGSGSGFVAKYDPQGELLWAVAASGSTTIEGVDVDATGAIYVTGSVGGPSTFGSIILMGELDLYETPFAYTAKLDATGAVIWATIETDTIGGGSIVVDSQGRVTIGGSVKGNTAGNLSLIQYDSHGNTRWSVVSNVGGSVARDLAVDSNGNVIVASALWTLSKYTPDGLPVWNRSFSPAPNGFVRLQAVAVDVNNNIYSTGEFGGTIDFDPSGRKFNLKSSNYAAFVTKLSSAGNFAWAKAIAGTSATSQAYGYGLAVDAASSVCLVGGFNGTIDFNPGSGVANRTSANPGSGSSVDDGFLVKLDSSGNFQYVVTIGGTGTFESARRVAVTASGTIKVIGRFTSTGVDFDPDPLDTYLASSLDPAQGTGFLWSLNTL